MTIQEAHQALREILPEGAEVTILHNQRSHSTGVIHNQIDQSNEWSIIVAVDNGQSGGPLPPTPILSGGYPCDCCGKQSWKLVSVAGSDRIVCRDCAAGQRLVNNYRAALGEPLMLAATGNDLEEIVARVRQWLHQALAAKPSKQASPSILDLDRSERKRDAS